MEYQIFFMLLKSFVHSEGKIISTNPLVAQGYVQIKKERQKYEVVVQINNFVEQTVAYLVSGTNIAKLKIDSATTKAQIKFEIKQSACVFIENYNLYACKNSSIQCDDSYNLLQQYKSQKKSNTLEKIFGEVYDTYFFDCIKPKLAALFAMGKPLTGLSEQIAYSKWVVVEHKGTERVFGVVYKNNFAYAVAVGVNDCLNQFQHAKAYVIDAKTYNILFLSASNGKIISF